MDIKMFTLQKLEKEREDLIKNKEMVSLKEHLQNKKKEVKELINIFSNMKKQHEIIEKEIKNMEVENNHLFEEIKRKEDSLYSNSDSNFKELELIKENIEELKGAHGAKEEELLELIVAGEDLKEGLEKEKEIINRNKIEFNQEFKKYKDQEEENLRLANEKEKGIDHVRKELSPEDYEKYKGVQKKYLFTGVALIEEGYKCSHCRLNVSVVKLREVERKDVTYCEICSRLLVGKTEEIK